MKGKRGKAGLWFDKQIAMDWVANNGSLTAGRKAAAYANGGSAISEEVNASSPESHSSKLSKPDLSSPASELFNRIAEPESAKRVPVTIDKVVAQEPGLLGNLERLKLQEYHTSAQLSIAKQANNVQLIITLSERHLHESKTLAALEQAALNFRMRIGELGPRAEMQNVFERVIVGIKNAVLGMPSAVIPQLIPYLRDPEQAHEVRAIIDKAARDSLRTVSDRRKSATS
jgi:hypothetical protein